MALTQEQLDALCGGPPSVRLVCDFPVVRKHKLVPCGHEVGPYYVIGHAQQAMRNHKAWTHHSDNTAVNQRETAEADPTHRATRSRLYKRD